MQHQSTRIAEDVKNAGADFGTVQQVTRSFYYCSTVCLSTAPETCSIV
jgi:hypothetical protein